MSRRRGAGEGSIRRRADGRWEATLSIGWGRDGRRRKSFYGQTRAEAAAKLDAARRQLAVGTFVGEQATIAQLAERYLSDVAAVRVRPRTLHRYRQIVEAYIVPVVGNKRVSALAPPDVQQLLSAMAEQGLSPRTAGHTRAVLRTMLNTAMRWGMVHRNVASLVDPPKVVQRDVEPLAPARARAILAALTADRLRALYETALLLGLRQSEVLGLQWRDIDLEAGTLRVARTLQRYGGDYHLDEPKTQRSRRTLAVPAPLVASLRRHRADQLEERLAAGPLWEGERWGDLAFTTTVGRPLHGGSMVTKRFQALLAQADLPHMTFHELRHGAATLMLALGADPRTIMETLGHSQISTTMNVYAHVIPQLQREASERVGAALMGG